jgi:hypothetical protein
MNDGVLDVFKRYFITKTTFGRLTIQRETIGIDIRGQLQRIYHVKEGEQRLWLLHFYLAP